MLISGPERWINTEPALTTASRLILTMATFIVTKKARLPLRVVVLFCACWRHVKEKQMNKLTSEISHEELIRACAPLVDVSMALDRLTEKAGGGNAGEIVEFMDDKVKRAMVPLKDCVDRIEEENPDQFS